MNDGEKPLLLREMPKPDSIEHIPSLHPATVRLNVGALRAVKTIIGLWEQWIKERQQ